MIHDTTKNIAYITYASIYLIAIKSGINIISIRLYTILKAYKHDIIYSIKAYLIYE